MVQRLRRLLYAVPKQLSPNLFSVDGSFVRVADFQPTFQRRAAANGSFGRTAVARATLASHPYVCPALVAVFGFHAN